MPSLRKWFCYYHIKRVKGSYLNAHSKTFLFFSPMYFLRMLIGDIGVEDIVDFVFSHNCVVIETTLSRQSDFKISLTQMSQMIGLYVVQLSCF